MVYDVNGNVLVQIDDTMSVEGAAADAKATGDVVGALNSAIIAIQEDVASLQHGGGGLTFQQFEAISNLFRLAYYAEDSSEAFAAFLDAFATVFQDGNNLIIIGGVTASQSGATLTFG